MGVLSPSSASYGELTLPGNNECKLAGRSTGDYSSTGFLVAIVALSLVWSLGIGATNLLGFGYSSNSLPTASIFADAFLALAFLSGASAASGTLSGLREAGFQFCSLISSHSSNGFCAKLSAGIFFAFVGWLAHVASLLKNLQVRTSHPSPNYQLFRLYINSLPSESLFAVTLRTLLSKITLPEGECYKLHNRSCTFTVTYAHRCDTHIVNLNLRHMRINSSSLR